MDTRFTPILGQVYPHTNGDRYLCLENFGVRESEMQRISDGWTVTAHGLIINSDGKIHWDYSTNGCWANIATRGVRL